MGHFIKITGRDLAHVLNQLSVYNLDEVRTLRIDPRGDRVAIKVNEGPWTAPVGEREERS